MEDSLGDIKTRSHAGLEPIYKSDRNFYRVTVWFLGLTALLSVAGTIVVVLFGKDAPQGVTAIGSAAVGALAGVFTATAKG